jgi:DNA polymerase-3 subunit delta'
MFADIIGHNNIIENLKNALRSGRIANAYVFAGPANVGKEFVALNFAKALNCLTNRDDPCDKCISCRRIDDGNHADVMIIRPDGTRLKIDQMRSLQKHGSYRAIEGNYKICIITEAEKMTAEAANSLLKTLEEPPGIMVLILLTTIYSALLPTIRSRCQSLKFSPVSLALISDEITKRLKIPESRAKWAAIQSQGRIGIALKLAKENEKSNGISLDFLIPQGQNKEPLLNIFKKAEELENTKESLDLLLSWYRDLLLIKQGCSQELLINNNEINNLEKLSGLYSDIRLEKLIKTIMQTQNLIKQNINPILAMEVMMFQSLETLSKRF